MEESGDGRQEAGDSKDQMLKPHMKLQLKETENRRIMNIELKNFEG